MLQTVHVSDLDDGIIRPTTVVVVDEDAVLNDSAFDTAGFEPIDG